MYSKISLAQLAICLIQWPTCYQAVLTKVTENRPKETTLLCLGDWNQRRVDGKDIMPWEVIDYYS